MEKTVTVPDGVDVRIDGLHVTVSGPKGELSRDFSDPRFNGAIKIEKKDSAVHASGTNDNRIVNAVAGTITAHIRNMVLGVSVGYKYDMKIMYTHFPITVAVSGREIQIKNFFGEKGSRAAQIVGETGVRIDKEIVTLTGINVEDVGQTAANIERACRLTKRDRRIFHDGIYLTGRYLASGKNV